MQTSKALIPPRSPWCLIQEDLWPNGWKILVACMLLNLTTRRAMEKILPRVFERYPTAVDMSHAKFDELAEIISPLGFRNRRTKNLIEMSKSFLKPTWKHAKDLPGIGDYGAAAWDIFVLQNLPETCPKDGALKNYYNWRLLNGHEKV